MTLGEFRKFTKDLPDSTFVCYHSFYKGCCLGTYDLDDMWIFRTTEAVVLNPGPDYDGCRFSKQNDSKQQTNNEEATCEDSAVPREQ